MNLKKSIKKIADWFDGKKTVIGTVIQNGLIVVNFIKPSLMPDNVFNAIFVLAGLLTGTGLAHKATKAKNGKTWKDIISTTKQNENKK